MKLRTSRKFAGAVTAIVLLAACGKASSRGTMEARGEAGADGSERADAGQTSAGSEQSGGTSGGVNTTGGSHSGGTTNAGLAGAAGSEAAAAGSGLGGSAGSSAFPIPSECEPRGRTETESECSFAAFCSGAPSVANCQRLGSGRWQCRCDPTHTDRVLEIEGATGVNACAVAAGVCSEDELTRGPESCASRRDDSDDLICLRDVACETPLQLRFAPGAKAFLMRYGSVICQPREGGNPGFDCRFGYGYDPDKKKDVVVSSDALACGPFGDYCMAALAPDSSSDAPCLPMRAATTSDGCERDEICASETAASNQPGAASASELLDARYANCTPRDGGGSDCYCSGRRGLFNFSLDATPDATTCAAAISGCAADASIEATGSVSCEPYTSGEYSSDACDTEQLCTEQALLDGRPIVAQGRLFASCRRIDAAHTWWCACASDTQTARFELGALHATAKQACSQAPEICEQQINVHFGPSNQSGPAPDPMPPYE